MYTVFTWKNIFGVQGLPVTDEMWVNIAAQACLLVLRLGFDLLHGCKDVIIYPEAFRVSRNEMDEAGIVHHNERILSGESWSRGPVILSWQDIQHDVQDHHQGHNVVVHEIAHKLDMLNGVANGMPSLHVAMQRNQWTTALSEAYEKLNKRLEQHRRICINPYAATSPAEFFAVFSEYFFWVPDILNSHFADDYRQLKLYYRQDPLCRRVK